MVYWLPHLYLEFAPVIRGKKRQVDGFVLVNIPVPELRRQGADFIISIELVESPSSAYQNGIDVLYYVEYLKQKQLEQWAIADSNFHIKIDMSEYDSSHFENYLVAIEQGYKTTRKLIPDLKEKLEAADV